MRESTIIIFCIIGIFVLSGLHLAHSFSTDRTGLQTRAYNEKVPFGSIIPSYSIKKDTTTVRFTCENRTLTLSCRKGYEIAMRSVYYGFDRMRACVPNPPPLGLINACGDVVNSREVVKSSCQGRGHCIVTASDEFLNVTPCPMGVPKNLEVWYQCKLKDGFCKNGRPEMEGCDDVCDGLRCLTNGRAACRPNKCDYRHGCSAEFRDVVTGNAVRCSRIVNITADNVVKDQMMSDGAVGDSGASQSGEQSGHGQGQPDEANQNGKEKGSGKNSSENSGKEQGEKIIETNGEESPKKANSNGKGDLVIDNMMNDGPGSKVDSSKQNGDANGVLPIESKDEYGNGQMQNSENGKGDNETGQTNSEENKSNGEPNQNEADGNNNSDKMMNDAPVSNIGTPNENGEKGQLGTESKGSDGSPDNSGVESKNEYGNGQIQNSENEKVNNGTGQTNSEDNKNNGEPNQNEADGKNSDKMMNDAPVSNIGTPNENGEKGQLGTESKGSDGSPDNSGVESKNEYGNGQMQNSENDKVNNGTGQTNSEENKNNGEPNQNEADGKNSDKMMNDAPVSNIGTPNENGDKGQLGTEGDGEVSPDNSGNAKKENGEKQSIKEDEVKPIEGEDKPKMENGGENEIMNDSPVENAQPKQENGSSVEQDAEKNKNSNNGEYPKQNPKTDENGIQKGSNNTNANTGEENEANGNSETQKEYEKQNQGAMMNDSPVVLPGAANENAEPKPQHKPNTAESADAESKNAGNGNEVNGEEPPENAGNYGDGEKVKPRPNISGHTQVGQDNNEAGDQNGNLSESVNGGNMNEVTGKTESRQERARRLYMKYWRNRMQNIDN